MVVVPLGPGKFYGSSLPRPRFYTDVKFSDERVDPPVSVLDPLLTWANEAHWSMGGLSFNRFRLQGKIEGNVERLRKEQEKKELISTPVVKSKGKRNRKIIDSPESPLPITVPRKLKLRSRVVGIEDEDEEEEEEEAVVKGGGSKKRRKLVRKLGDDFEMVANENGKTSGPTEVIKRGSSRNRVRRNMVLMEDEEESDGDGDDVGNNTSEEIKSGSRKNSEMKSVSPIGRRSSPRLKRKLD